MDDSTLQNRRRFLEGVSVGGGILLAGCSGQFGGDAQENVQGDAGQSGSNGVAAVASVDQQAMRKEQAAIRQKVQSGEMNQTEAQQEMASLQTKYVSDAVDSLTGTLEETDGVTVGKTYDSFGVVTVEGEAGAILGLLESDDVRAFVSISDVEEQVAKRNQQANSTSSGQ
ncbi:hypothetical protein [Halopelagius longus]|uniref:Twin-arginine translocation signal domain-containing protein n=1 Tax=Halopelagius longus TaxID=1236180 RepID=A0A1H0Z238_9EURY|nr:hypothetical protein [Halopelagius longus]RDI72780.1 hypothetical protein DWB78_14180 [Halopelagius longus]SDQ21201.1 hypothetical protein SAMN05216278_0957 [Halopelagius longus]